MQEVAHLPRGREHDPGELSLDKVAAERRKEAARETRRNGREGSDLDDPRARMLSLDDVDVTVCPYLNPVEPAHLSAYRDAGVDQLVLTGFAFDPDGARTTIGELGDAYVSAAAAL